MKSDTPRQWFPPSQLAFYFDQGAWSRGTTLYLQNKVVSSQLTPDGEGWRLQGQVEGSEPRPYTVNAELRVSPGGNLSEWRSGCTCPVGRYCKHGAALGILASMQGLALLDEWGSDGPSAEVIERRSQMEKERALSHAEYQARDWLTRLENANGPSAYSLPGATQDQFVYLLSVAYLGQKPLFHLSVKRAAQKRNGEWGKPKKVSNEPSPHDPIWSSSSPLDRDIFDLMKACPAASSFSSYGFQGEVKLHGMPGQLLLKLRQRSQGGRSISPKGIGLNHADVPAAGAQLEGHRTEGQLQKPLGQPGGDHQPPVGPQGGQFTEHRGRAGSVAEAMAADAGVDQQGLSTPAAGRDAVQRVCS
jgi:hypothetical protein